MANFDLSKYALVEDRIAEFYRDYPEGSIRTRILRLEDKVVVIEARIYRSVDEVVKGVYTSGIAREVEGSGPVNRTNHTENCECVPLTVPALTRHGWKFFHQLAVGDEVLAYDVAHGVLVWDRIRRLSIFPDQPLLRIGNTRFRADCTPDHRWVVDGALRKWNEITAKASGKICLAARFQRAETSSCDDAARLGWLFGDCTLEYTNGLASRADIAQSKPEHFGVLERLFGQPRTVAAAGTERHWPTGKTSICMQGYAWPVPAAEVRRVLGMFRVNDASDLVSAVMSMTSEEADAFLDSMLRSDGSGGVYAKTCPLRCAAVQLAMFITGHSTGRIAERAGNAMTTKPCYTVSMHRKGEKYLSEFTSINLPPQDVWCPTTKSGTWVGLFGGRPAITGNTSAIGRALANLNYPGSIEGKRAPRPSREEMEAVQRKRDEDERHTRMLEFAKSVGERCNDDVQLQIGGGTFPLKEWVRANWRGMKESSHNAATAVAAIEAATGQTFAA